MATRTGYFAGGFDAAGLAGNMAERWDSAAGYTRWSKAGAVLEQRALTADETAALAAQDAESARMGNETTVRDRVAQAMAANRTYIALSPPTAAQTTAQVKALSRQMNALARLAIGQLDGTD